MNQRKNQVKNENNNPFNGSLTIRGKLFEGIVINAKAKGTAVIQKESPSLFQRNLKDLDEVKVRFMLILLPT